VTSRTGASAVGEWIRAHAISDPWTDVVGLARTLLALGTAGTLLLTPASVLFSPAVGSATIGSTCHGPIAATAFCVGGTEHRQVLTLVWGAVCLLIASGWRPRVTALVHWWIAYSFFLTATISDGGDQVTAVLTLLILPIALTDPRAWHWAKSGRDDDPLDWSKLVANWGLLLVRMQVAFIYLDAAISKMGSQQWANGTAMYYWLRDPVFGVPASFVSFEQKLLGLSGVVVPFTYGVICLELSIGIAWLLPRIARRRLLIVALAFHVGIAVVMGLVSFAFAMVGALVIYLLPVDEPPWIRLARRNRRSRLLAADTLGAGTERDRGTDVRTLIT
jgi:antimicrobial peptide system SdpB family protein